MFGDFYLHQVTILHGLRFGHNIYEFVTTRLELVVYTDFLFSVKHQFLGLFMFLLDVRLFASFCPLPPGRIRCSLVVFVPMHPFAYMPKNVTVPLLPYQCTYAYEVRSIESWWALSKYKCNDTETLTVYFYWSVIFIPVDVVSPLIVIIRPHYPCFEVYWGFRISRKCYEHFNWLCIFIKPNYNSSLGRYWWPLDPCYQFWFSGLKLNALVLSPVLLWIVLRYTMDIDCSDLNIGYQFLDDSEFVVDLQISNK